MKRCPECRRDYYDDTLSFCLEDGAPLVYGLSQDEPATAILSVPAVAGGSKVENDKTRVFKVDSTDAKMEPKGGTPNNSIAVLPFVHMSADTDNEYFCDGLAEELLNALAKVDDLKVAARTSSFSFRDKNTSIGEIGRALGVKTILEGSVRKSGDRMRITVQLVNAADGYHLWSERYDPGMQDIFDVQDAITLAVVDALKLKLLGTEKAAVLKRHTENTEAYKAYLMGRYLRHTKNDHGGARRAFEEAVRVDPTSAPSWVGLAEGTILAAHYSLIPALEAIATAKAALATAKELQGESADGFYVEGFIAYVEANWPSADKAYRRAIALEPNHTQALGSFGLILCVRGQFDEALTFFQRARESDPLSPFPYAISGVGLGIAGQLEQSMRFYEQALTFEKQNILALWGSCAANIRSGRFDEGIAAAETVVAVSRRAGFFLGVLGWALAVAGRTEEANAILAELRNRPAGAPSLVSEVWLLSALGDKEAAFKLLEKAEGEHQAFVYYVGLAGFDVLRGDSRLNDLIRRNGLPEQPI